VVLGAIGAGDRTFTLIARTGGLPTASLHRALRTLVAKRVVEALSPLSTQVSRETRYIVADPHLRFWLALLGPYRPEIERGRGDLVLDRIRNQWARWRGRAIEPVVLESLRRLPAGVLPAGTRVIGGYWTRNNDPEIDLVGADQAPVARKITMVGSIKWLERRTFDSQDLARLVTHRTQLPGANADTPLLAVSRSGVVRGLDIPVLRPADLLVAYP
jgi:hypothetical protein